MAAVSYKMPGDKSKLYFYSDQQCEQYFLLLFLRLLLGTEQGNGARRQIVENI